MAVRFIARVPDPILHDDGRRSALAHLCGELVTGANWLEADVLVSLVEADLAAVVGLLPDEGALTPALSLLRAGLGPEPHGTAFELYRQSRFTHADGVWQPDPAHHVPSVVGGPHGGRGVRILIQRSFEGTGKAHERLIADILRTRSEHGCVEYAWTQSDLHPQHHALLELWATPQHYDAHWALRLSSGVAGQRNTGPAVARAGGSDAMEFYRHTAYREMYGRVLPADADQQATTIRWPLP
jgi:hypothetical protein